MMRFLLIVVVLTALCLFADDRRRRRRNGSRRSDYGSTKTGEEWDGRFWDPSKSSSYGLSVSLEPLPVQDTEYFAPIVGGYDAMPRQAPFFTMLLSWNSTASEWQYIGCSGTLISNQHVLTSAHCVYDRSGRFDAVYINAYQPFRRNAGYSFHFSRVESYTTHDGFNSRWGIANDVAIVKLKSPVDTNEFEPVTLGDSSLLMKDNEKVTVLGFGQMSERDEAWADTLQTVDIPFISQPACKSFYRESLIRPDMICGGDLAGGPDACFGDSGGPMIVRRGNKVYQVGLASWGEGCGRPEKPGVYASTAYHYSWIQQTVCSDAGVDMSLEPCAGTYPTAAPSNAPSSSPVVWYIRNSCKLKKAGQQCQYAGQCCSGVCALRTIGSVYTFQCASKESQLAFSAVWDNASALENGETGTSEWSTKDEHIDMFEADATNTKGFFVETEEDSSEEHGAQQRKKKRKKFRTRGKYQKRRTA